MVGWQHDDLRALEASIGLRAGVDAQPVCTGDSRSVGRRGILSRVTSVLDIPPEPADRSVVLDRDALAWQRRGGRWYSVAPALVGVPHTVRSLSWEFLLLDRKPLAPLITEAEEPGEGWRRAGYTAPDCERYAQPAACATTRAERGDLEDSEGPQDPPSIPDVLAQR